MESKATFGGGCFWCTEAIFQELEGIIDVKSGYSGGHIANPAYREVCNGSTGHAEVIELTYNPEKIKYEDLLLIHLTTHDPTTMNRQGADRGSQYRSVIFYRNEEENEVAKKTIEELKHAFEDKIVTEIAPFDVFYEAEIEHQGYYARNSEAAYCQAVINPKLKKFRARYQSLIKPRQQV